MWGFATCVEHFTRRAEYYLKKSLKPDLCFGKVFKLRSSVRPILEYDFIVCQSADDTYSIKRLRRRGFFDLPDIFYYLFPTRTPRLCTSIANLLELDSLIAIAEKLRNLNSYTGCSVVKFTSPHHLSLTNFPKVP